MGYIALPGFKRVNGLNVEADGSFTAFGVNSEDQWMLTKIDAEGNVINTFGENGSFTVTAFDGITDATAVIAESNGGFTLLSGQRDGVNGFDNTLIRLGQDNSTKVQNILKTELVLFPNPLSGDELSIKTNDHTSSISKIYLIDLKGCRTVIDQFTKEGNIIKTNLPASLNPGIYYIELVHQEGKTVLKFLKD